MPFFFNNSLLFNNLVYYKNKPGYHALYIYTMGQLMELLSLINTLWAQWSRRPDSEASED